MEFNVNSPGIFIIASVAVVAVLAQSIFFLVRSLKRSKELNIDKAKIKKVITTSIISTFGPACAILVGVVALSKSLGFAVPWLRLSIVGSITYETQAAKVAVDSMSGISWEEATLIGLNSTQFATTFLVMTACVMVGIWLVPAIGEKYSKGIINLDKKDPKWSAILSDSLFMGMVSAFLGSVFSGIIPAIKGNTSGLVATCVFFTSALAMALCGILLKKLKWNWLKDYAQPISLVIGMASAIPFTMLLG